MKRVRKNLSFDTLEDRKVLAVFSVLDSFSAASPGDDAVDSGGTSIPAGIVANSSARSSDTGIDTDLQATDPLQAADVRTVSVTRFGLGSTKGALVPTEVDPVGYLAYSSDILTGGTLVLQYDLDHILTGGEIEVDFSFMNAAGPAVSVDLEIHTDGGVTLLSDVVTDEDSSASFDASGLVGQRVDGMVFTISGNPATDLAIDQINAPLETVEQAAIPLRTLRGLALGLQKQLGEEIAVKNKRNLLSSD